MPTPNEKREVLDDLATLAMQEVSDVWRDASLLDLSSPEFRSVITQAVPEIVDPYAATAGDLAAGWYDESAPELEFKASPAELPPPSKLATSTSWALQATGEAALIRMAGFTTKAIFDQERETVVQNAEAEPGATWARHAQPGACSFCRLLASRNEVYASKAAATSVVGRGKAMSESDRRARSRGETRGDRGRFLAGGTRTRGTQALGDRYHDHCRCTATEVRPGMTYIPPSYAQAWEKQYTDAVKATADGGPINLKAVLSKMDELDGGRAVSKTVPSKAALLAEAEKVKAAAAAKKASDTRAWLAAESAYVSSRPALKATMSPDLTAASSARIQAELDLLPARSRELLEQQNVKLLVGRDVQNAARLDPSIAARYDGLFTADGRPLTQVSFWDKPIDTVIVAADAPHGSVSVVAHELGHALDSTALRNSPAQVFWQDQGNPNLPASLVRVAQEPRTVAAPRIVDDPYIEWAHSTYVHKSPSVIDYYRVGSEGKQISGREEWVAEGYASIVTGREDKLLEISGGNREAVDVLRWSLLRLGVM